MDEELKELSCACDAPNLKIKSSIGTLNDHFHFVQCGNCSKRTRGKWTEEEAINNWVNGEFYEAT